MEHPRALQLPHPNTLVATLTKPILERLVLWYLRAVSAQQDEINTAFAHRLATLENTWRKEVADQLNTVREKLAAIEEQLRREQDDRIASLQLSLADWKRQSDTTNQVFAYQISCLTELIGDSLPSLARPSPPTHPAEQP